MTRDQANHARAHSECPPGRSDARDGSDGGLSDPPQLTESGIRGWSGDASFEQGEHYLGQCSILNPRRQGDTLKARCLGAIPSPYHVQITLQQGAIVSGECSCPSGVGGRCKHAVALLLAWLRQPETFRRVEDPQVALARLSKAELIALIGRMLARYPGLEGLLGASGGTRREP